MAPDNTAYTAPRLSQTGCREQRRGKAQCQRDRHGAQEIPGRRRRRIRDAASAQRVQAPGDAGRQHQARSLPGRCRDARQHQDHQTGEGQGQPEALPRRRTLSGEQAAEDHRRLHGGKQQQGAGAGRQRHIGIRKRRGIHEQGQRRSPVAARRHAAAQPRPQQQGQHQRARQQAQAGEAGRIDAGIAQGRAAEQGIGRERGHRRGGQRECPRRGHHSASRSLYQAIAATSIGVRNARPPGKRLVFDFGEDVQAFGSGHGSLPR